MGTNLVGEKQLVFAHLIPGTETCMNLVVDISSHRNLSGIEYVAQS